MSIVETEKFIVFGKCYPHSDASNNTKSVLVLFTFFIYILHTMQTFLETGLYITKRHRQLQNKTGNKQKNTRHRQFQKKTGNRDSSKTQKHRANNPNHDTWGLLTSAYLSTPFCSKLLYQYLYKTGSLLKWFVVSCRIFNYNWALRLYQLHKLNVCLPLVANRWKMVQVVACITDDCAHSKWWDLLTHTLTLACRMGTSLSTCYLPFIVP